MEKLDEIIATEASGLARWLDRAVFVFLFLMVVSAPHSIAATQTAWLSGLLLFVIRFLLRPRISIHARAVGFALVAFFLWTVVTSFTSYAPDISISKLKQAGLFLIFFFVVGVIRTKRAAYLLVFALIGSCLVNAVLMPIQRIVGRGVEIVELDPQSDLARAGFQSGDVILEVDGKKVSSPEEVLTQLAGKPTVTVKYQNLEFYYDRIVANDENNLVENAGIQKWKHSRSWRSSGFYGHYTTYAEVLQLIGSLVIGLLVAGFLSGERSLFSLKHMPKALEGSPLQYLFSGYAALLVFCAFSGALLLTVTRAPQLAFLISGAVILTLGASRKWVVAALILAIPAAAIGLFVLQRTRDVGFVDPNDAGQSWRTMVWREGINLWTSSPRNVFVGVGMDSIRRYACDWGLYDNCRSEFRSHFHSTPIQLLVERGLPGLLLFLLLLGIYGRTLWRSLRNSHGQSIWRKGLLFPDSSPTIDRGIWLGALGGSVGFLVSGLVHYNYGDGEVAMVFYLIMGLSVKICSLTDQAFIRYET